ncbi:MAG: hypothetical protein ACFFBP_11985 [Promethearchaeota archaeon]
MILQIGAVLGPLAGYGALFVIILGIIWLIYGIYEAKRRGSFKERKVKDWDYKITVFLKILTFLGFFVGLICIVIGISGLYYKVPPSIAYYITTGNDVSYFTSILLIVLGILAFLKPMNDLPIASMIALGAAAIVTFIVYLIIPLEVIQTAEIWGVEIIIIIIFIIIFCLTAVIVKFYAGALMGISKVISWPPLAIIVSVLCFIQGFLLLVSGISIIPF